MRETPDNSTRTVAGRSMPRWTVELVLVAVLYVAYDTTRGLRHGSLVTADDDGARILRWEHTLHLTPEHALNQLLWHVPVLAVLSSYDYATLHFVVTPAVLIWMYRRHPEAYRPARTALVVATVVALVVFWLLPTTPPRLLPGGAYHDILASVHGWGWWSSEGSAPRGLGGLTNQLAAMPSLHVGWAVWSGWLLARHATRRWVRVLGVIYPLTTALVVMGTGNHYFFDTLGGLAVMLLGAAVAGIAYGRWSIRLPHRLAPVAPTAGYGLPPLVAAAAVAGRPAHHRHPVPIRADDGLRRRHDRCSLRRDRPAPPPAVMPAAADAESHAELHSSSA